MTITIEGPPETIRRETPKPRVGRDTSPRTERTERTEFHVAPPRAASDAIGSPPPAPAAPAPADPPAVARLATAPPSVDHPSADGTGPRSPAFLLRLWAVVLAAGFLVGGMLEPLPDGAEPVVPTWVQTVDNATAILLLVAFFALLTGRRWGVGTAAYGSAGLVVLSALCPTIGHHSLAAWWYGQLAISVGLLVGSLVLRSRVTRARVSRVAEPARR